MKLSLTLHEKTYSIDSDESFDGTNLEDLVEQFKGLLVNAGFHPSNVDHMFNTEYQWFTEEERNDNMQGHLKKDDLYFHSRAFETSKEDEEKLECLCRDRKVQEYQDNLYRPEKDDDDEYDMFK